jgi:hypothetical protein
MSLERLSELLQMTGLNAVQQSGQVLLYNRKLDLLSKGVLVPDVDKAVVFTQEYLRYIRTHGIHPVVEFAAQFHKFPVHVELNTIDQNSAYYDSTREASKMSLISQLNLLNAAQALEERAYTSALIRKHSDGVTKSDLRRYMKLKRLASKLLEGAEKVR